MFYHICQAYISSLQRKACGKALLKVSKRSFKLLNYDPKAIGVCTYNTSYSPKSIFLSLKEWTDLCECGTLTFQGIYHSHLRLIICIQRSMFK